MQMYFGHALTGVFAASYAAGQSQQQSSSSSSSSSSGRPPWDYAKKMLAWMFNGAE
jgi:hypothetical protein